MKWLVFLLFLGCAPASYEVPVLYQEPEFSEYVKKFDDLYNTYAYLHIPILFTDDDLGGDVGTVNLAFCYDYGDGNKRIEVSKKLWRALTENGKESLIFHELGHCILNREHDKSTMLTDDFGKIPASIMYPIIIGGSSYYPVYRGYYYLELGRDTSFDLQENDNEDEMLEDCAKVL